MLAAQTIAGMQPGRAEIVGRYIYIYIYFAMRINRAANKEDSNRACAGLFEKLVCWGSGPVLIFHHLPSSVQQVYNLCSEVTPSALISSPRGEVCAVYGVVTKKHFIMAKEDRSSRYRKEKVTNDIFNSAGHIHFKFLLPPASPDVGTDDSDTDIESDDQEEYFPILQRQEPIENYSDLSITDDLNTMPIETVERVQQSNETATKERSHCSGATIDTDREDTDSSQISDATDTAFANPGQSIEIAKQRESIHLGTPPPHPDTLGTNDVQTDIAVARCNDCNSVKMMAMDRTYYDHEKRMKASEETRNENENVQAQQKETIKTNTDLATTSGLNEVPVETNETAAEKQSHCADAIIEEDREDSVNIDTMDTPVAGRTLTMVEEVELAIKRLGPAPPNPDSLDSNVSDSERRATMIRYNDYIFDKIMAADLVYKKHDDLQKNKKLTTVDDTESEDSVQIVEQPAPLIIVNNETDESDDEVCNQNEAQEHTQDSDSQDSISQTPTTSLTASTTLMHDIMSILSPQCDEPGSGNEDVPLAVNEKNGQEIDFHWDENTKERSQDSDALSVADLQQQVSTPEVNKELPNITSFAMLQSMSRKRPTQETSRTLETETVRKSLSSSDGDNSPRNLSTCGVPKCKIARKSRPRTRDDILQITDEATNNTIFNNPKASTSRAERVITQNLALSVAPKRKMPRLYRYGPADDILLMVEAAINTMFKKLDAQRGRRANERARLVHLKRRSLRKRTDLKKSKSGPYCHYTSSYPNSSSSSSSETFSD